MANETIRRVMGTYGLDAKDVEKYETVIEELDIPKIVLDLVLCVMIVVAIVATMIHRCLRRRQEAAAEEEELRRVQFDRILTPPPPYAGA